MKPSGQSCSQIEHSSGKTSPDELSGSEPVDAVVAPDEVSSASVVMLPVGIGVMPVETSLASLPVDPPPPASPVVGPQAPSNATNTAIEQRAYEIESEVINHEDHERPRRITAF